MVVRLRVSVGEAETMVVELERLRQGVETKERSVP